MGDGLWQRLVLWEVRHALRGKLFWVMAAAVAVLPWLLSAAWGAPGGTATGDGGALPGLVVAATQTAMTLLVALWVVFAVKRQLDKEVSDDWLLVLRYRESLASRFVAGGVLGLLLVVVAVLGCCSCGVLADPSDVGLSTGLLVVSLLQPLAVAALVVAAADFLLAGTPLVLFVVTLLAVGSAVVPVFGFAVPVDGLLTARPEQAAGELILLACDVVVCALLLWMGWRKAEDFWAYLRIAKARKGSAAASLGEVRGAVQQQAAQRRRVDHSSIAHLRERYRRRGWEPLWAFDLARYPAWVRPSREHAWVGVLLVVGLLWTAVYAAAVETNVWIYLSYFGWMLLAVATPLRVLVSAAGIVVQEKEQGTLAALLATPYGVRRILWVKLGVVLRQALPALLLLTVWQQLWLTGLPGLLVAGLWAEVPLLAVCGVICSALAGSRLLSTVLSFVASGTALVAAGSVAANAEDYFVGGLNVGWQSVWFPALGIGAMLALAVLLWTIALRPCTRLLQRQAA